MRDKGGVQKNPKHLRDVINGWSLMEVTEGINMYIFALMTLPHYQHGGQINFG